MRACVCMCVCVRMNVSGPALWGKTQKLAMGVVNERLLHTLEFTSEVVPVSAIKMKK